MKQDITKSDEFKRAMKFAAAGAGVVDTDKIQDLEKHVIAMLDKKQDEPDPLKQLSAFEQWGDLAEQATPWKAWTTACQPIDPSLAPMLEAAKAGLPTSLDKQARLSVRFFPDLVFHRLARNRIELNQEQEVYFYGLVKVQGLLMKGRIKPQCAGLGEQAGAVLLAMATYWIAMYGRILAVAVKVPGDEEAKAKREQIFNHTFESACLAISETVTDARKRACAKAALTAMQKDKAGLYDLTTTRLDETGLTGVEVLRDVISGLCVDPEQEDKRTGWASDKLTEIKRGDSLRYKGKLYEFGGKGRWDIIMLLYNATDPDGWVTIPGGSRSFGCFSDYARNAKGGTDKKGDALRFKIAAIEPRYQGSMNTEHLYRIRP